MGFTVIKRLKQVFKSKKVWTSNEILKELDALAETIMNEIAIECKKVLDKQKRIKLTKQALKQATQQYHEAKILDTAKLLIGRIEREIKKIEKEIEDRHAKPKNNMP